MLQDQGLPLKAGASAICIWRSWGKGLVGTSGEKLCVCVGVFVCMCVWCWLSGFLPTVTS